MTDLLLKKTEECVQRIQMPPLPAKVIRGITLHRTQMPPLPAKVIRDKIPGQKKW